MSYDNYAQLHATRMVQWCLRAANGIQLEWVDYWDRRIAYFTGHGGFSDYQFKHAREQRAISQASVDRLHAEAISWASR